MSLLVSAAAAAALVMTGPIVPTPGADGRPAVAAATEVVIPLGPYHISGFWGEATIPEERCPREAPYLNRHEYHEGSGWLIPRGVSIDSRGAVIHATIVAAGNGTPTGIEGGKVVSWSTATDVTVRLHCTDRR